MFIINSLLTGDIRPEEWQSLHETLNWLKWSLSNKKIITSGKLIKYTFFLSLKNLKGFILPTKTLFQTI